MHGVLSLARPEEVFSLAAAAVITQELDKLVSKPLYLRAVLILV